MRSTNRKNLVRHFITLHGGVQNAHKALNFHYSKNRKPFIYTAFPQQYLYFLPLPQGLVKCHFLSIL